MVKHKMNFSDPVIWEGLKLIQLKGYVLKDSFFFLSEKWLFFKNNAHMRTIPIPAKSLAC